MFPYRGEQQSETGAHLRSELCRFLKQLADQVDQCSNGEWLEHYLYVLCSQEVSLVKNGVRIGSTKNHGQSRGRWISFESLQKRLCITMVAETQMIVHNK